MNMNTHSFKPQIQVCCKTIHTKYKPKIIFPCILLHMHYITYCFNCKCRSDTHAHAHIRMHTHTHTHTHKIPWRKNPLAAAEGWTTQWWQECSDKAKPPKFDGSTSKTISPPVWGPCKSQWVERPREANASTWCILETSTLHPTKYPCQSGIKASLWHWKATTGSTRYQEPTGHNSRKDLLSGSQAMLKQCTVESVVPSQCTNSGNPSRKSNIWTSYSEQ
jgi:hypothetical protein